MHALATQNLLLKVGGFEKAQEFDVEILLRNGANVNARDEAGETALVKSVWAGSGTHVRALLKAGANVNLASNKYGVHPTALSFVRGEIRQRRERGINVGDYPEIQRLLQAAGTHE